MKLLLTFPDVLMSGVMKALDTVAALAGEHDIKIEAYNDPLPEVPKKRGKGPTVRYHAIAGADALQAIGETTVRGLVYAYLLKHGPCTEKSIREKTTWTRKQLESSIDKLKRMGVVHAEPIAEEQPTQEPKGNDVID